MTKAAAKLRSLRPVYVPDQHRDYVEILTAELTKSGREAPRNIALTGHYGSGKSSVLEETQRVLEVDDVNVINLSIPSLGIGDGRVRKDGDKPLDKTNLIQKEIVKQLLYRRSPSAMPASRYSRLDTFRVGRAMQGAVGVGAAATGFALLAKVPDKVRDALPSEAWAWLNSTLWSNLAGTIQWLSLFIVFVLTVGAALWVQRLFQQRIRVTELTAGPTKVTLSDSSSSYFDEYLDEIVYFFQTSKTAVVIFEDLDRFKDPHIFETLRELNMLLNNAEQTGTAPIRFVYAIRDSVFEQLDVEAGDGEDEREDNGDATLADQGETRRLMSTNRTKFFDLVVPMVPFISHRTSRDLIRRELAGIVPEQRPNNAVVDIVGSFLTDMRLIKNICNEYEVFRRRILTDGGLKELTAERLFASIVYKNIYLADYEKIRDGTSLLDTLYHAYREWVAQQTAAARNAERGARTRLRRLDAVELRSATLGTRLQNVLLARHGQNVSTDNAQVVAAGTTYSWSDILTAGFWRAYLHDRGNLGVYYRAGYSGETVSFDKVQTLMGYPLSQDGWTDEATEKINNEIRQAVSDHRVAQHASMTDAIADSRRLFSYGRADRSMADVAEELFGGAELVLELLRAGLIDENFTLYITQFPGQAISASAMNFIIKAVQPDVMDIEYHFGAGDEVNTEDIKAVLKAEAQRLLGGQSVYNIEVFDYLMAEDPSKLDEPIRRLATNAANDRDFIDAYLTSGTGALTFIERLSGTWPDIFDFLIAQDPEAHNQELLDAALRGVSPELTYPISAEQRSALATALPDLPTVSAPQSAEKAVAIAETIQGMGLSIGDLNRVAEPLRTELSKRSVYPVTLANLVAVLGDEAQLSLDCLKNARESDVYGHILAHLRDYLSALDQATSVPTVADPNRFVDVLSDVAVADVDALEEVARGASSDCMLSDLDQLEAPFWPAIAGAHRLALTAFNVVTYIAEHDVDADLASWLRTAGSISVTADDTTPLGPLALNLLNAAALGDEVTLQLVDELELEPESISAASLHTDAHTVLPALVQKGLIRDDADAYASLEDDEWGIKKQLIAVSHNFPSYMTELPLSTKELFWIASEQVPSAVRDVLLTRLEAFAPKLGQKGATALAIWAAAEGRRPTPDAIVTLATKGGWPSTEPILKLLGAQAATIDLSLLQSALNALGKPYSKLTTPGWERPEIDVFEGVGAILARLKEAGVVSKFEENAKKHVFEVSKRHS
ncbi:hypothetical protein [Arthrobacter sp. NPDC056493]|uniref:YobI family P-loop NTPase n=1 Tax=Arthrobacter sp. NPDC056493 TaxID=3345839 RepID=UPI003671B02D